jgi:hypothetical protein
MNAKCETCRHWMGRLAPAERADCRRHAPAPALRDVPARIDVDFVIPLWPQTFDDDWCGEHEPVPAAPK